MKKKSTKSQHNAPSKKEQLTALFNRVRKMLVAHGVFVMFVIAGLSIGFALYKSSGYINPPRDEAKYKELSANTTYSKIDYSLVQKLSESLNDPDVKVTQNIAPGRKNPFSE